MSPIRFFIVLAVSVLLIMSCDSDDSTSPKSSTGTLKILLTDAPGEYDAVNVTFSEVSVHYADVTAEEEESQDETSGDETSEEWIIINSEEQTFDLLTLVDGATAILGESELETGHYTQIRLKIVSAEVVIDETAYNLTIPSDTVKFVSGFDITADNPTELIVDFDAARSIHITDGKEPEYKMIPTIRIINNALCGSISGHVTNYENLPIAYAIAEGDTVSSSYVKKSNGRFTLGFLPGGTYTVSVSDTLGQTFSIPDVLVTIGTKTDLGDITLE